MRTTFSDRVKQIRAFIPGSFEEINFACAIKNYERPRIKRVGRSVVHDFRGRAAGIFYGGSCFFLFFFCCLTAFCAEGLVCLVLFDSSMGVHDGIPVFSLYRPSNGGYILTGATLSMAILYNPIIPIDLDQTVRIIVDYAAAGLLFTMIYQFLRTDSKWELSRHEID